MNEKGRKIIKAAGEKALATASQLAVELILEAAEVVPECQQKDP